MARALIVDLNNFARYPTISVGVLASLLREAGHEVEVLSPLAHGIEGMVRETPARPWGALDQRLRYWSAVSAQPLVRWVRRELERRTRPIRRRERLRIARETDARLEAGSEVVLVSTYLMYFDVCREIVRSCERRGVPVVVGSSYLNQPEIAEAWSRALPGAVVVGAEAETVAVDLVSRLGGGKLPESTPGAWWGGARIGGPAPSVRALDEQPFPDYRDFPWRRYPRRIIPIQSGRGCRWGVCTFCSDVTSTAGRGFRSRSLSRVLDEMQVQAERHRSQSFVFTDLKLNSDLAVWRGLAREIPARLPGARWIGAVHVEASGESGLDRRSLEAASRAGLVRLTTGLETGSQRMNDRMRKGTRLEETSRFLRDASAAGISVRATLIVGHPDEEPPDVDATRRFLEEHHRELERVVLNRFVWIIGTPLDRAGARGSVSSDRIRGVRWPASPPARSRAYRRAVYRLIDSVHRINAKPIATSARVFEGVM